ncbi:MAG: transposase [Ignavibacteriae bacterium]|nr:transposase [Ignavibacteriota bacterium]
MFPVGAMSEVMMGKFIELLKEKYEEGKLRFPGKIEILSRSKEFNNYLYKLSQKKWVIYSKAPFSNGERTLEYISRYTHKVAISNSRIKSYEKGVVRFEYKNYKKQDKRGIAKKEILPLEDTEFIRRFLLHILPEGFRKIRYGGIFAPNKKKDSLNKIEEEIKSELGKLKEKVEEIINELEEKVKCVCPECESKVLLSGYG